MARKKNNSFITRKPITRKGNLIVALGLLASISVFSLSKVVLEPVGKYIYQSSIKDFTGTDHLLNANGLSDRRILAVSSSGLAIINSSTMSVSGSTDYLMRSSHNGGRDAAIYEDNHQTEGKASSMGFGISKITEDEITSVITIKETDIFFENPLFGNWRKRESLPY